MRRLFIFCALLALAPVGCERFSGPVESRNQGRADAPGYNLDEQRTRARERYAISEDDFRIGPKGFIDRPSPTGR